MEPALNEFTFLDAEKKTQKRILTEGTGNSCETGTTVESFVLTKYLIKLPLLMAILLKQKKATK